jgi:hypothetical protein
MNNRRCLTSTNARRSALTARPSSSSLLISCLNALKTLKETSTDLSAKDSLASHKIFIKYSSFNRHNIKKTFNVKAFHDIKHGCKRMPRGTSFKVPHSLENFFTIIQDLASGIDKTSGNFYTVAFWIFKNIYLFIIVSLMSCQ